MSHLLNRIGLIAALLVAAPAAMAAAPGAPAYSAAGKPPPAVVVDTSVRVSRKPTAQLLAEADSAVKARGGAHAENAQLFLSWDAPWGQRRARRERKPACADSVLQDTLYLCMTPGRTSERFLGFTAELLVHSTGADTLGPWWHMQGKGGKNPGAMSVEWAATQDWFGAPQPFAAQGQGFVVLEPQRSVARVRLIFGMPVLEAVHPLKPDLTYVLARIVLKHNPQRQVAGCASPVVIEWVSSTLTFDIKDEPRVARGERFVSFGGPYALTEPFRGSRAKTWKPPAKPAPASVPATTTIK